MKEQIEEMAKTIKSTLDGLGNGSHHFTGDEFSAMLAERIYNAFYCKKSDLIEEFIYRAINLAVCKDNGDGTERLFVSTENLRKIAQEMKGGDGKMTLKEKSIIERMLGFIEGAAYGLDDKVATPILSAIETIDNIIEKEKGGSE